MARNPTVPHTSKLLKYEAEADVGTWLLWNISSYLQKYMALYQEACNFDTTMKTSISFLIMLFKDLHGHVNGISITHTHTHTKT